MLTETSADICQYLMLLSELCGVVHMKRVRTYRAVAIVTLIALAGLVALVTSDR